MKYVKLFEEFEEPDGVEPDVIQRSILKQMQWHVFKDSEDFRASQIKFPESGDYVFTMDGKLTKAGKTVYAIATLKASQENSKRFTAVLYNPNPNIILGSDEENAADNLAKSDPLIGMKEVYSFKEGISLISMWTGYPTTLMIPINIKQYYKEEAAANIKSEFGPGFKKYNDGNAKGTEGDVDNFDKLGNNGVGIAKRWGGNIDQDGEQSTSKYFWGDN